jgi:hypothetical protein
LIPARTRANGGCDGITSAVVNDRLPPRTDHPSHVGRSSVVGRFLPVAAAWDVSISWIGTCANNDSAHQGQKKPASAGLRVLHCVEASANRERFQYAAPLLESRVRMTHIFATNPADIANDLPSVHNGVRRGIERRTPINSLTRSRHDRVPAARYPVRLPRDSCYHPHPPMPA